MLREYYIKYGVVSIRSICIEEPKKLGLLFKDKKLPVLSPRELVAYVNLPTALDTLPVKTASIILGPPPEIVG